MAATQPGRSSQDKKEKKISHCSVRLSLWIALLLPLLSAFVFAAMMTGYTQYGHSSHRLYFPFETRSPSRPPPHFAQFRHLRKNATETAAIFRQLVSVLVTRYMSFHRTHRFRPDARKLIWTGKGNHFGFGDRFRGILQAYLCAVLTDRVLLIAWDDPFPLSTVFTSAVGTSVFYDARLDPGRFPVAPPSDILGAAKNPPPYSRGRAHVNGTRDLPWCDCSLRNLGLLLSRHRTVISRAEVPPSLRTLFLAMQKHPHLATARSLASVTRRWRSGTGADGDEALYAVIFRALFRPARPLLALLARQSDELTRLVWQTGRAADGAEGGGGYVAVHARIGVGFGEVAAYPKRFDLAARGASVRMIGRCLARVAAEEAEEADLTEPQRFYIASDTRELAGVFKAEMRRQSAGAVVLELPGKRIHSNRMNPRSKEDRERFMLTVAELLFLSAGKRLVSLKSGFANLAKWFGEPPHKEIRVEQCVKLIRDMGQKKT